jgi:uncharacterized protein (TIGR04255 family)
VIVHTQPSAHPQRLGAAGGAVGGPAAGPGGGEEVGAVAAAEVEARIAEGALGEVPAAAEAAVFLAAEGGAVGVVDGDDATVGVGVEAAAPDVGAVAAVEEVAGLAEGEAQVGAGDAVGAVGGGAGGVGGDAQLGPGKGVEVEPCAGGGGVGAGLGGVDDEGGEAHVGGAQVALAPPHQGSPSSTSQRPPRGRYQARRPRPIRTVDAANNLGYLHSRTPAGPLPQGMLSHGGSLLWDTPTDAPFPHKPLIRATPSATAKAKEPAVSRTPYPRPPITEAVIDLRFAGNVEAGQLIEALERALGDQVGGPRQVQDLVTLQATRNTDGLATEGQITHLLTLLSSADGLRLVGCGDGMLSVHVLAPYPGWAAFIEQATAGVHAVKPLVGAAPVHQIAVRYVDRIVLPATKGVSFQEYLTAFPGRPPSMPGEVLAFHHVTQSVDPADGTLASLVLASAPPPGAEGRPVAILDLTVWQQGEALARLDNDAWLPFVEHLHHRQREVFEDCITDRLRESFR